MLNRLLSTFGISGSPINKYWHGIPYHDCERLGITIHKPTLQPGQTYLQAVVVHLLTKEENGGNHNEYFDVIDKDDKRLNNSLIRGKNNNIELAARVDKPPNEFGTNFSVYPQDTIDAWVAEVPNIGPIASDVVRGFSTRWGGDIVGGQAYGHISIYVIWKIMAGSLPPIEPPVGDCDDIQKELTELKARVATAIRVLEGE